MIAGPALPHRRLMLRKTTIRGRGSIVGGTASDIPPPPNQGGPERASQQFPVILLGDP